MNKDIPKMVKVEVCKGTRKCFYCKKKHYKGDKVIKWYMVSYCPECMLKIFIMIFGTKYFKETEEIKKLAAEVTADMI